MTPSQTAQYEKARRSLSRRNPHLRETIRRVGPCTLKPNPDTFHVLVRTIVSQQLSTKAANSICARLDLALGERGMTIAGISSLSDAALRGCGLSGGKVKSMRDLCAKVSDGTVPLDDLPDLPDVEVKDRLVQIHGIGPWSADMLLMFSLGRLDILPVGDLGLRSGVQALYGLSELPGAIEIEEIALTWKPYRSIATWYVWRSKGPTPQS